MEGIRVSGSTGLRPTTKPPIVNVGDSSQSSTGLPAKAEPSQPLFLHASGGLNRFYHIREAAARARAEPRVESRLRD